MSSGLLRFEWWESLARAAGRAGRWTVETAHRRSIRSPTRTDGPLSLSVGIAAVGELSLVVRACRISQGYRFTKGWRTQDWRSPGGWRTGMVGSQVVAEIKE